MRAEQQKVNGKLEDCGCQHTEIKKIKDKQIEVKCNIMTSWKCDKCGKWTCTKHFKDYPSRGQFCLACNPFKDRRGV
jgi:hypothetical protein